MLKRVLLFAAVGLLAVPTFAQVPNPESHFGHKIGEDKKLLDWDKVVSYFNLLAKSSDKIKVAEYGRSAEGRPLIVATIADPATLKNLDKYKDIQRRLSDPRKTSAKEAEALIPQAKNIILITCSIHATEVASTHTAVEYAYKLITENTPHNRAILQNNIVLLAPSINPDGVDIVTQWYRKTLGTKSEGTSPPELYQKYVGHDNNRDWYIFSQPETRATISQLHNVWHPEIVYDVHQQGSGGSRIFIPPWLDPIEPNIDPILSQEMNWLGSAMASDLTAQGKTGVAIHAAYDFWSPSRHYQSFHGGMRILTESASVRLASPITLGPDDIETSSLGYNPRERSWNYLQPWLGGTWRIRDIIDYQLAAFDSLLYNAALKREDILKAFYTVNLHQIQKASPWGIVVPKDQRDPGATRKLLETLAFGDVEVSQDAQGNYVIPMAQPYSGWAKSLLERQQYPTDLLYPGGPPKRPYDVTAHTLPLLFGVDVSFVEKAPAGTLKKADFGKFENKASYKGSDTDAWKAVNAAWSQSKTVYRNAAGDFSFPNPGSGWTQVQKPRIGLYKSFAANMDEGWTRWLLEEFGFQYTSLRNADIQTGNLKAKFDVIVLPDEMPNVIQNGARGNMPAEFTGGLGDKGAEALKAFAEAGGTLVCLNKSSNWAIEHLGVKAKNVLAGVPNKDFYSPGSLLNVKLDTKSPLAAGLPADITIWSESSPAFTTEERSVAKYTETNPLASGWLLGEKFIQGKTALVDAKAGAGHIILFGMRPQYRAQSYLTFKLFFNALTLRP